MYLYCANQASGRFDLLGLDDCTPHFEHTFEIVEFSLKDGLGNNCFPKLLETISSYLKNKVSDGITDSLLNYSSEAIASAAQQAFSTLEIQRQLLTAGRVIMRIVIKSKLRMKWISCCDRDVEKVQNPRIVKDVFFNKYHLDFQEIYDAVSEMVDVRDDYIEEFEEGVRK